MLSFKSPSPTGNLSCHRLRELLQLRLPFPLSPVSAWSGTGGTGIQPRQASLAWYPSSSQRPDVVNTSQDFGHVPAPDSSSLEFVGLLEIRLPQWHTQGSWVPGPLESGVFLRPFSCWSAMEWQRATMQDTKQTHARWCTFAWTMPICGKAGNATHSISKRNTGTLKPKCSAAKRWCFVFGPFRCQELFWWQEMSECGGDSCIYCIAGGSIFVQVSR